MGFFDIVTENFVVEITIYKPRLTKCGPHSSQASIIEAKILDELLYNLEKNKKSIQMLHNFADFNKAGWAEEIASQIVGILNAPRL